MLSGATFSAFGNPERLKICHGLSCRGRKLKLAEVADRFSDKTVLLREKATEEAFRSRPV